MKIIDSIKSCLAKINPHYFSLLVIILIALVVTCFNLGITKEFIGDDAGVGYHYSDTQLKMVSNMWNSYIFPGKSDTIGTIALIHVASINVLNRLGLTSIFIDRLYYFLFYFVSGLGMYFLSHHICNKLFAISKNKIWFVSLIGAVFYMLNNFTMVLLSFPPTNYVYSYMLLPWIFLLYLKDFHISNDLWRKLIFGITFLFLLSGNPANTIIIIFLLLLYELFFRDNNKIVHNLKGFAPMLLLILLLSSFIYLPVLGNKENPYGKVLSKDNRAAIAFSSSEASIANLLRLRGNLAQNSYVFNEFLLSDKIIIVNYLLLVIALLFLFKKKVSKLEIFLVLTFILFLFLAKAEHAPFAWLNRLIYAKVPFFEMYRSSYFRFVYYCVFSLSILLSISLLRINENVSRLPFSLVKKFIIIFMFFIIIFSAKPFWGGEVVRDIFKTTIPIEYYTINTYFSKIKTDFSVLSLPQIPMGLTLDWGNGDYYGGAAHPDMFMIGRPVWSNGWFLPENSISTEFSFYKNILSRSNIKYVLLHKDIPESYSFKVNMKGNLGGQTNFNKFNDQIISDKNFRLIEDTNFFKVFEINQEEYKPLFYTSKSTTVSLESVENLSSILSAYQTRSTIFFNKQNKNIPSKVVETSEKYLPLFDRDNSNTSNIIMNNNNANIFFLKKSINSESVIRMNYLLEKEMLVFSNDINGAILINAQPVEESFVFYELPARLGDIVKIGSKFIIVRKNLDEEISLADKVNVYRGVANLTKFNLNLNNSFESGLWQEKPGDCTTGNPGEPDLSMRLSQDATDGKYSLELGSKNHYACTSKTFPVQLSQGKLYKLSFDYKNVKGSNITYYYNLGGKEKSYQFSEIIKQENHDWNHYETFIEPEEDISGVILYFYAPSDGTKEVVNRFDNVKLEEWMPKDVFNYYLYSPAKEKIETPVLEFKKINPTKYVIKVHGAKNDFPLVFSESFHKGWKVYLVDKIKNKVEIGKLANYKILEGNDGDQATKEQVIDYINKGWVSALGNGRTKEIKHKRWESGREKTDHIEKYQIDFISQNFQDTIQNDNLFKGHIWDTCFKESLSEENHLIANGYANSWTIETEKICQESSDKCVKNPDGSYDFELIVEFWPQRMFYLGLFISGMTFLGCLGYLGYDWKKRKRNNIRSVKNENEK